MGVNDSFKWVKGDRDFVQNLLEIEGEEGKWVEGGEEKGREIIRGLGKREEREQEEEGFWERVELEEEEEGKGRKVITGVLKWSLEIGYVPKQFRRALGVVMRKPRKEDYGKPERAIWGEKREEQYGRSGRAV
ncbi:hypothetical protein C7212DRAFT_310721 [Tuber magnatum]|uniref:Uncharacterized protein n=1 Tax=Tuber magnatum TaxID=42249 RepID=A0A317T1I9_9PEZI|nr:hypothetical protein C7212DRAFT_310721 [Tuber magnatum]